MPDKKYLIEIPDMPDGSGVWDADKWERNKDAFMADYPNAQVFELGEYDDADSKESDQILLSFEDEASSGIWDQAKWERNKYAFTKDNPEAQVSRIRYVDYWGQKAEDNRTKREELSAAADEQRRERLAQIGYYDDTLPARGDGLTPKFGEYDSKSQGGEVLKPLTAVLKSTLPTGEVIYSDPKIQEFFATDEEQTNLRAEIARLDAEYESNPKIVEQREWMAQMLAERKAYAGKLEQEIRENFNSEVDAVKASRGSSAKHGFDPMESQQMSYLLDIVAGDKPGSGEQENEKSERYTTALKFLEKAKIARNVAGKGMGYAVIDWAKEGFLDAGTQDDVEAYNEIGNILTRLEKEVGSLKEENLTEEVFEKYLSKDEQALIKSFFEYNAAMAAAQQDMSRAYKGGKIFAESIPFMLEFLATGGIYKGAGRAATKGLERALVKWVSKAARNTASRTARKIAVATARDLTYALVGTTARTLASPGTYERMAEASVEIEDGHLNRAKNAAIAAADMYVENLSEISGGLIGKTLGWAGKGVGKLIAKTPLSKVGGMLADNKLMQSISAFMPKLGALGFHGLPEEIGEEFIGNAIREVLNIQPGALKEMVSDDNFGAMLIGFAPMTLIGAAGGAISLGAINYEAVKLGNKMREMMSDHYSAEEMDAMMSIVQNAGTAEEIQQAIKPMALAIANAAEKGMLTQEQAAEEIEMLYQWGGFMAQNNALLFSKKAQDNELANAKRAEMVDRYGRFWQEDETESVQVATLNNGSTVFVTSAPAEDGKIATIDVQTGKKGFANISDIASTEVEGEQIQSSNKMTMAAFLNGQIAMGRKTAEETRMSNERNAQIDALRAEITPGTRINLGTEGSPVYVFAKKTSNNGVTIVDETGMESTLGWEQAADALGKPIIVETDQQKLDAEVSARLQRLAERRMQRNISPAVEDATTEAAEESAEIVAQENKHIPLNEDGTVNEAAFWTQDPEGYAEWNDEQNQDGGQDTLRQIAISKAEMFALLADAQSRQNTSNPVARKAAEKEAAIIAEKIQRLQSMEMKYADALEEEKKAVQQTAATPTVTMSEEQLEQMDAQYQGILGKTRIQSERVRVMQEYLDKLAENSAPIRVLTKDNYVEVMKAAGCSEDDIKRVGKAIRTSAITGAMIAGFASNGVTFVMADTMADINSARITYIHERQHLLNSQNPEVVKQFAAALGDKENALRILETFVGKNGLEEYENDPIEKLADEIICRSMEIVYSTENYSVDLQNQGLSEEAINIINTIDNGQRTDKSLSSARRSSHANLSQRENAEENGRNSEQVSGGILDGEETGSIGSSGRGDGVGGQGSTGEGAEVISEEQLNAPNSGTAQQITATDGEVLADTDGKGGVRFSIRTWNEGGRDYLAAWLANDTILTEEEKADILARMDEFYKNALLYSDTYAPFGTWSDAGVRYDNNGNPLMSVIKANGDYAMNLDFSLVCKKRRPLNRLLRTLVNRNAFASYTLRERELAEINWILQEHGFEVACALCFVDSKRYRVTGVADVFAALYNRLVKSLAPEGVQIAHFNYNENPNVEVVENGLDTMSDDQLNWDRFDRMLSVYKPGSVEHKVAQYLREHPEARKLVDATDFIEAEGFESVKENNPDLLKFYNMKKGTGGPKASFGDVQYLNDILKKEKSFYAEKAYAVGGVRLQSFSDFVPHMYFDYMQLFAELAAKKLPLHAYTKEVLFAKIFGLTGAKINMSLVPAVVEGGIAPGLDAEGNYAWADPVADAEGNIIQQGQSFPYDEAMAIQQAEGYSKNCGVIAVGISDAHIEKMLDDPNIPFIIPYHKSSLNAIVARMTNIDQYKDYTNVQNTRKASGSKPDKGTKDFNFNEYLHGLGESGTPQQAAQAYLDWCRENNYKPKFSQFAYHPNYYKLLQDFNTIDLATGEYAPQGAVTMTFPTEESAFGNVETLIQQGLQEDAELEEKMEQEIDGIADQVIARLEEISKEPKMSEKQQTKKMAELADERTAKIKAKAKGPIDLIAEAQKTVAEPLMFRFIGEKAAINFDRTQQSYELMNNLEVAREMLQQDVDARKIKAATGWEMGADGRWRLERPDFEFKAKPGKKKTFKLSELIEDASLFAEYPQLKNIKVRYKKLSNRLAGEVAQENGEDIIFINEENYRAYNPTYEQAIDEFTKRYPEIANLIFRGKAESLTAEQRKIFMDMMGPVLALESPYIEEMGGRNTLAHEIQHLIQKYEGFAEGGSEDMTDTTDPNDAKRVQELRRMLSVEIDIVNDMVGELNDILRRGRAFEAAGYRESSLVLKTVYDKKKREYQVHMDNVNYLKKELRKFKTLGAEGYKKLAGEVEARNVEKRLNMTEADRRQSLYSDTQDVATEDQIFLRNNLMTTYASETLVPGHKKGQPMLSDAEMMADVSFRITKNTKATIEGWCDKAGLETDAKNTFVEYIDETFGDTTEQLCAAKWYLNGAINLPNEDTYKVKDAVKVAKKNKVDALLYDSPMDIIYQFGKPSEKQKPIDPDSVSTLKNKKEVPGTDITIYDVEEGEESRQNMREIINTHYGKNASPWCLLQGNEFGELTPESKERWDFYSAYPKQVAFKGGRLLAFSANSAKEETWWDRLDKPYEGVPVMEKLNDKLNRRATSVINPKTGEKNRIADVHSKTEKDGYTIIRNWDGIDGPMLSAQKRKEDALIAQFNRYTEEDFATKLQYWFAGRPNGIDQVYTQDKSISFRPNGNLEHYTVLQYRLSYNAYGNATWLITTRTPVIQEYGFNRKGKLVSFFSGTELILDKKRLSEVEVPAEYKALINRDPKSFMAEAEQLIIEAGLAEAYEESSIRFRFSPRTEEQREQLFENAKNHYGLTNNFNASGYMLPDGSLLDFSEANNGGDPNRRSLDHRDVEGLIMDEGKEYDSRYHYVVDFVDEGAIRMLPEAAGFQLSVAPTAEQRSRLMDYIYKHNGEVIMEITDENGSPRVYMEYNKRTSPSRIFRDMDGFFNEGIVPGIPPLRFRIANENQEIFVSNAAKAVEGIKQEKATPEQWLKMIEKNGGLKAGEDKWMGLSDYLKASDKKTLTKQDVFDFINENMIIIEEQHYGEIDEEQAIRDDATNRIANGASLEELQSMIDENAESASRYDAENEDEDFDLDEWLMDIMVDEYGDDFRTAYTIEGGIIEFADVDWWDISNERIEDVYGVRPIEDTRLGYTTRGLTNNHEIALTVPTIEPWEEHDLTHFGDAGEGRAIAWIRFGETYTKDINSEVNEYLKGKYNEEDFELGNFSEEDWERLRISRKQGQKVLVIDEIQSKRHQKGREKGYTTKEDVAQRKAARARAKKATNDLYDYIGELVAKYPGTEYSLERVRENRGRFTEEENNKLTLLIMEHNYAELELEKHRGEGVPDAPFDKNWYELAMKRMLRYAAENGYDVVAWTTGDQQARRYDLSRDVTKITVSPTNSGDRIVNVYYRDEYNDYKNFVVDTEGKIARGEYEGNALADVVGKEMALQIMNTTESAEFKGEGLKIGGEGMRGFYDKMLPSFMNKYGKKWGVKVEDIDLPNLGKSGRTMHSIPVTEEMKASVMEGQVMFRTIPITQEVQDEMDAISATAIVRGNFLKAPNGADTNLTPEQWAMVRTKNFLNWFGDWINDPENASKVVDENGEPKVVFHGSNWRPILEEPGKATFKMRSGLMGRGAYFTDNFTNAADYAREKYEWENYKEVDEDFVYDNGYITEAFLNIRNEDNIREYYGETYYLATDPSQIKSATDNTGEYSTEDKDIRYRVMSDVNTNPTEAQKKAGNYKMGHIRLDGYNITIENPKGSVRRGTDSKGNAWENTLNNDYGYIRGTEGVDGDHIDVYLSDNPTEGNVYVIDQVNPETREFDEYKVMYGFNSAEQAREAYLANFSEGWNGLGTITEVSKDEFKKWIESSHRKTKPFSEYKSVRANEMQATDESELRYRVVSDQETLDRLNSEPTIKVYRAMQLIDGKLYPPMSAKVDGELRQPIELGQWEEAEERPDLVDEKGRFKLDKGNKSSLKARYNPYFHTSPTPLNDQFSSAQTRPELVTVEVEVPESELTSGYKAEKAKDSVGKMEWKAGVVQSKLSGTRTVILSRWDKPVRIVPDSEVADVIVDMFEGRDITMPSNVVTPSLRDELEKRGVPFVETDNQGNPVEEVSFRVTGTPTDEVVTNGLQLTPAQTAEVAANIFAALPEESRKKITEGLNGNIFGLKDAILQIPTSLASKENWNDEDKQMAAVVREVVQDLVDANPTTRPLTTKEALWMLYDSTKEVKDLVDAASRAFVAYNLGFDPASMQRKQEVNDYLRFRTASNGAIDAATDMYNYETSLWTERLKESWLDMNQSVKSLQEALAKSSGIAIEPWENIVFALNQLSSKSYVDKKKYLRDFIIPLWDAVQEIVTVDGKSLEEIERYMMLKHGLERNKKFAARDAKEFYRSMYDLVAERMKNQSHAQQVVALSEAKKALADIDAKIAVASSSQFPRLNEARARALYDVQVADLVLRGDEKLNEQELQDYYDNIDNELDSKYWEFREKDYGGLTSMFVDSTPVQRSKYKSEEAYQKAVLAATKPRFDKVADMEAEAQAEVDYFEKVVGAQNLWDKVNAATKETLRHQYEAGMITIEQYEAVRDMFDYYVPLRGFADNTAVDMYSYYMDNSASGFAQPILGAKGRKTRAESPLGWIGTMAESAIQADNKNEAKMTLYYATLRRPDQNLLSITETWYENTGQRDANNKKIFAPAYPPATDRALNADELRQHMEDWEDDMRKKQSRGEAYKGSQKVDLKGSVVFQDSKEEKEHIIRVKVAGKDYSILINGNPRAAQAINSLLNPDVEENAGLEAYKRLQRFVTSGLTSASHNFWLTNFQRDLLMSIPRAQLQHGGKFAARYAWNRHKAWRVFLYLFKSENKPLGDSYFEKLYKEFAENGGITGYTVLANNKEYEKLFDKYAKEAQSPKLVKFLKTIKEGWFNLGEAIEQVSRFAAYVTAKEEGQTIEEAIQAAKEVSVNFNRKGSAKSITADEIKKLRMKNGLTFQQYFDSKIGHISPKAADAVTKAVEGMIMGLSAIPYFGRLLYFFFNAGVQSTSSLIRLAKQKPGAALSWFGAYAIAGFLMYEIIGALWGDDDEEVYQNLPEYERRNSILVPVGDGVYLKWALPQEMRTAFGMGDAVAQRVRGLSHHKQGFDAVWDIAGELTDFLPINPLERYGLNPDLLTTLAEIRHNESGFGSPIYKEFAWKSEEEMKHYPKYRLATPKTNPIIVDVAKFLNDITAEYDGEAGWINWNPASIEHALKGYLGGRYTTLLELYYMGRLLAGKEEFTIKNTPFAKRILLSTDETNMYSRANEQFSFYKGVADNAKRVENEYVQAGDLAKAEEYREEDDWRIYMLYKQYEADFKNVKERLGKAVDKEEEDLLKYEQNILREMFLDDVANGTVPEVTFQIREDIKRIDKEIKAAMKPVTDANKERLERKKLGDMDGMLKAIEKRDSLKETPEYMRAEEFKEDLTKIKNQFKELGSVAGRSQRDSVIGEIQKSYDALVKKMGR